MFFPKEDFPLFLSQPTLVYLDSAATTLKPQCVIEAMSQFYARESGSVHRGIYALAERSTIRYEQARSTVARFIGADHHEIVFTSGATESINFIAYSWASVHLQKGDEIIVSEVEHHANILPWIRLEKEKGIIVSYIPYQDGNLDYEAYEQMLTSRTKLVAITHTSNVVGLEVDLHRIRKAATLVGAKMLVDATQAAGHMPLDVTTMGADFVVFSGHKMFGPTGIGVLYIPHYLHDDVVPYKVGGGMVHSVDFHDYSPAAAPHKFEAGTPPIAQAIGLEAAILYLQQRPLEKLKLHERELSLRLIEGLKTVPSISLASPQSSAEGGHIVSFTSIGLHPHDIAAYLDQKAISVRAGHHCAQPLHRRLGLDATVRVSLAGYSTKQDVDLLVDGLSTLPTL